MEWKIGREMGKTAANKLLWYACISICINTSWLGVWFHSFHSIVRVHKWRQFCLFVVTMAKKENLLLLFERPQEPVFVAKGPNNAVFDVPSTFLTDRFRNIGTEVQSHFTETAQEVIPVRDDVKIPDLKIPLSLGRHEQFSLFIPKHRRLAAKLIDIFMSQYFFLLIIKLSIEFWWENLNTKDKKLSICSI